MTTTFIAIANLLGIACVSDGDHTLYKLSSKEPLAVAVYPNSPLPWYDIIATYKRKGAPAPQSSLKDYADDFEAHLKYFRFSTEDLSEYERSITFLGYGKDDLYPSKYVAAVASDHAGNLRLECRCQEFLTAEAPVFFSNIGSIEHIEPILLGTSEELGNAIREDMMQRLKAYADVIRERFAGTPYEAAVADYLDNLDLKTDVADGIDDVYSDNVAVLMNGVSSFSVADLVDAAEKLVNANLRLTHLAQGAYGPIGSVQEIAVITRTEGLTWIKHDVFAI